MTTGPGNLLGDRDEKPNALPPGTRLGDFEITGTIGEGGFGIVYAAFDHSLQRRVAVKEYMPNALANRRGDASVAVRSDRHDQTFKAGLRSFINEARMLAQFDHPALIKVYAFWEQHGTAYMAMQIYEGKTLREVLRESPRAEEAWLKKLLPPLLDVLETLHSAQCYHRDIAPDNILILKNGNPVLLDFGAARRIIGDMTQAVTVILKPGYAPIEQYADDATMQQGPWTDVYALAGVLHLAITGKAPPASVARMINDPLLPLRERVQGYSEEFLSAIDRGLIVRPEQRPQSIAEFRQLLGVSSLAPGAGSWTQHSTPSGATTISMSGPKTTFETQQTIMTSPPTGYSPTRSAPGPVTGGTRALSSTPGVSSGGGSGIPPRPTSDLSAASGHPSSILPVPPGTIKPKISAAAMAAVVAVSAIGIAVVIGIYFAVSSPSKPAMTVTTSKSAPEAPIVAPPVTPPAAAPAQVPVPVPPPAPAPAVIEPAPDPDDVAWESARVAGTKAAIDDYLNRFPAGKNVASAKTEQARIVAATAPTTVRVNLAIKPWGNVLVNGVPQGASPPLKKLELKDGKYKIDITNGTQSYTQQIEVKLGQKAISIAHQFNN
ncbi:MAG: serine/threonine-protein kinase [Betaproteobacteria bacterium]